MKKQRLTEIESYLRGKDKVSIEELSETFQVSINTIRRDIKKLDEEGVIKKFYGGVTFKEVPLNSFENRFTENLFAKKAIAKKAAELINEGDIIYIDSGTTTATILEHVKPEINLTIFTNSLDIIEAAVKMENVNLYTVGRHFRRKTRSFIEIESRERLMQINITKAFMAVTGVSVNQGLANQDFAETEIKSYICQTAEQIILLADRTKFNKPALLTFYQLKDIDVLVTNHCDDEEIRKVCQDNKIDFVCVG
ncbi:DeoR/GlpR transcriptional regulator [Clostridiales bacterium COT073_COT-073]|nr:DeoR/GlpR transcriptional regulator [Clostridiales bacterium COT073_COT-073]